MMCENQLASQPLYRNIDYTTRNAEQLLVFAHLILVTLE
jgi:hypothetical protein